MYPRSLLRNVTKGIFHRAFPSNTPTTEKPVCNICGFRLIATPEVLSEREMRSCAICGSTLRFRAIVAALQSELDDDGRVRVLARIPKRKHVKGIGMSDTGVYAYFLRRKFDYLNTFYHIEPKLDICSPARHYLGQFDFIVSSDVLEHVDGPTGRALGNLRALLKTGGILALTVPYGFHETTIEHYPDLYEYRIEGEGANRILVNVTEDGREQRFTHLCFHGGDGSTLELRIYAYGDLVRQLGEAGFTDIRLHDADYPEWGIIHRHKFGLPITAKAA
ncbi:methyltransferase domain-containing protein [Dyella choica]|uniref:Methyltransferase domain-containing protein n=1 Tax=Dyella choica TaxID=1927959 RepID=A0A432MA94_9GAMM|nr:methyltransferase domain-containing protein [Dyella choica]RUL79660.1 methyltransferase domain-containing protein [Dyella choica]